MAQQVLTVSSVAARQLPLSYLLHVPRVAERGEPERLWPLVLFLHGAGERGDDPEVVKAHGIPKLAERDPDLPFIAISPQCPTGTWWTIWIDALLALLDEVASRQPVDPQRVYLTGISMGGYGSWALGALHPERFAAVAPICGGGTASLGSPDIVCALKDTPVWAFHGALDDVVVLSESEVLVERLRACGGNVRFTVYPDAGHDSWTQTYDDPAFLAWLLAQKKGSQGSSSG
ncbi:MAG: carboxylesterase family protein [Anaerolineae bacterium]